MIPALKMRSSRLLARSAARSSLAASRSFHASAGALQLLPSNSSTLMADTIERNHSTPRYPQKQYRWLSSTETTDKDKKEDSDSSDSDSDNDTTTATKKEDSDSSSDSDNNDTATATKTEPPKHTNAETLEFQAETKQLLDIVTNSLYTDKDVFLRELISNASDALEKLRHLQATNEAQTIDPDVPLEIRIEVDEANSTITITDTGIGLTRDDMIQNLGTIARSGSKNFLQELQLKQGAGGASQGGGIEQGIIGKFGVGFYSAFMVGDMVEVRSKSALQDHADEAPKVWYRDSNAAKFEIANLDETIRQGRGSSVVIHLKEEYWSYCTEHKIEEILKRYSNFVNFPIFLNGTRVNTIDAVWVKDPKEVEYETYVDFYKYISNNIDNPLETIHFRADAPLDVKALFFIPSFHSEKYGMGRMEPGVSLYSRKVLIEAKSPDILPGWMRFLRGVVDSEDLPLSISREKAQDSALIAKLRTALTRKFISHITKMAKKNRSQFVDEFYKEYAFFLKEGICQDPEFQAPLSKLLFFETSKNQTQELTSLDEYISRMRPEQNDIYFLCAPTRDAALNSPYLETFEKADVEVLFMYTAIEDFVMANLEKYEGRNLVSAEKSDIDLSELTKSTKDDKDSKEGKDKEDDDDNLYKADRELSPEEALDFCMWFKKELGEKKISSCTVTNRLSTSPAIVTDHESGSIRRMMRLVDTQDGNRDYIPLPKQHVEINPSHPVIVGIFDTMKTEPTLARILAEQVYDNCLIAAGLLDDGRTMLPRLNDILICVVNGAKNNVSAEVPSDKPIEESNRSTVTETTTATDETTDAESSSAK